VVEEDNKDAAKVAKDLLRRHNVYVISVWLID